MSCLLTWCRFSRFPRRTPSPHTHTHTHNIWIICWMLLLNPGVPSQKVKFVSLWLMEAIHNAKSVPLRHHPTLAESLLFSVPVYSRQPFFFFQPPLPLQPSLAAHFFPLYVLSLRPPALRKKKMCTCNKVIRLTADPRRGPRLRKSDPAYFRIKNCPIIWTS